MRRFGIDKAGPHSEKIFPEVFKYYVGTKAS